MANDITKEKLSAAIQLLMEQKPLEKISVAEIVSKCGLTRQTFYRHFKDKFDLVNWTFYDLFGRTMMQIGNALTWDASVLQMLQALANQKGFYASAFQCDAQNCLCNFELDLVRNLYTQLIKRHNGDVMDSDLAFLLEVYCIGAVEMTARWARNGMEESPQRLTQLFKEAMPPQIRKLLVGD